MFETKNTTSLDRPAVNQVATYLGDRIGRLGFIASREPESEAVRRNLKELLVLRGRGQSTTKWMQQRYLRVVYVPDPEPDSVFVITAYTLEGKPLTAYKRRRGKKK